MANTHTQDTDALIHAIEQLGHKVVRNKYTGMPIYVIPKRSMPMGIKLLGYCDKLGITVLRNKLH